MGARKRVDCRIGNAGEREFEPSSPKEVRGWAGPTWGGGQDRRKLRASECKSLRLGVFPVCSPGEEPRAAEEGVQERAWRERGPLSQCGAWGAGQALEHKGNMIWSGFSKAQRGCCRGSGLQWGSAEAGKPLPGPRETGAPQHGAQGQWEGVGFWTHSMVWPVGFQGAVHVGCARRRATKDDLQVLAWAAGRVRSQMTDMSSVQCLLDIQAEVSHKQLHKCEVKDEVWPRSQYLRCRHV